MARVRAWLRRPVPWAAVLVSYIGLLGTGIVVFLEERAKDDALTAQADQLADTQATQHREVQARIRQARKRQAEDCALFRAELGNDRRELSNQRDDLARERRRLQATRRYLRALPADEADSALNVAVRSALPRTKQDVRAAKGDVRQAKAEVRGSHPPTYCKRFAP